MKSLPEIVESNAEKKKTRSRQAGETLAESIIDMVHLMYQKRTANNFLCGLITRLEHLSGEFK